MRWIAFLTLAMVAACGGGGDRQGIGGVTADEAAQLNNAAEMLDSAPNASSDDSSPPDNSDDASVEDNAS